MSRGKNREAAIVKSRRGSYTLFAALALTDDPIDVLEHTTTAMNVRGHTYMGPGSVEDYVDREPAREPFAATLGRAPVEWVMEWQRKNLPR